jgi:hypothetical protein
MELVKMAVRDSKSVFYERSLRKRIDEVGEFADSIGKRDQFEETLSRVAYEKFFGQAARTLLIWDFAPQSFGFVVQVGSESSGWKTALVGGLIFYSPDQTWSIHT